MRYNVNLVGLLFFIIAVVAAYFLGGWKFCLWTAGVLGCIGTGRLIWLSRRGNNRQEGGTDV